MAAAASLRSDHARHAPPLRILTAVPICDGHDSAVTTINLEPARHGSEVIYLGYRQAASAILRVAIQEDAHLVGRSSYNSGHLVFLKAVVGQLRRQGRGDIPVFGGGGGTITPADARVMQRQGAARIFFAGSPLDAMLAEIIRIGARATKPNSKLKGDHALAQTITRAADSAHLEARRPRRAGFAGGVARTPKKQTFIVGIAGPGGALLGDRVSAIYSQDDRACFRCLATRGSLTGLSAAAPAAISILQRSGEFDLISVESVGVGQESDPFRLFGQGPRLVDATLFVLAPYYGGRIQLQKIALPNGADFQNNLTRTAVELMLSYLNYTNSCHSNSADESFTTPKQKYATFASHGQSILMEESGVFKYTMNLFGGAPGFLLLESQVEKAILEVFREMDSLGRVLVAQEQRYQRSKIQEAGHTYEKQIDSGARPIIGLNKYKSDEPVSRVPLARTAPKKQSGQAKLVRAFRKKQAEKSPDALQKPDNVVRTAGNVFAELGGTVEVCSLDQITACLTNIIGKFRPMV